MQVDFGKISLGKFSLEGMLLNICITTPLNDIMIRIRSLALAGPPMPQKIGGGALIWDCALIQENTVSVDKFIQELHIMDTFHKIY